MRGRGVYRVGEILPCTGDAGHDCLTAELGVGADLAGHAGDFRCERSELVHRFFGARLIAAKRAQGIAEI